MSHLADGIKQLRLEHGLTQASLAKELHVSQNAVFNWENGKREPNITTIRKIADYFQIPAIYLIEGKDSYEKMLKYLCNFAPQKMSADPHPSSTDDYMPPTKESGDRLLSIELEEVKARNYYDHLMAYGRTIQEWYQRTCAPLNDEGRKKVIEYAEILSETCRYQRQRNEPA